MILVFAKYESAEVADAKKLVEEMAELDIKSEEIGKFSGLVAPMAQDVINIVESADWLITARLNDKLVGYLTAGKLSPMSVQLKVALDLKDDEKFRTVCISRITTSWDIESKYDLRAGLLDKFFKEIKSVESRFKTYIGVTGIEDTELIAMYSKYGFEIEAALPVEDDSDNEFFLVVKRTD